MTRAEAFVRDNAGKIYVCKLACGRCKPGDKIVIVGTLGAYQNSVLCAVVESVDETWGQRFSLAGKHWDQCRQYSPRITPNSPITVPKIVDLRTYFQEVKAPSNAGSVTAKASSAKKIIAEFPKTCVCGRKAYEGLFAVVHEDGFIGTCSGPSRK